MLRGILPSLAKRFSPLFYFILLFLLICKEREREDSVKSPLLINEYFLSREGKERDTETKERENRERDYTQGPTSLHGRIPALCQPMEIHQRERKREMEQEEKRKTEGGSQAGD